MTRDLRVCKKLRSEEDYVFWKANVQYLVEETRLIVICTNQFQKK